MPSASQAEARQSEREKYELLVHACFKTRCDGAPKRTCAAYPNGSFETTIFGYESDNAYDLQLITVTRDGNGNRRSHRKARIRPHDW